MPPYHAVLHIFSIVSLVLVIQDYPGQEDEVAPVETAQRVHHIAAIALLFEHIAFEERVLEIHLLQPLLHVLSHAILRGLP